MSLLTDMIYGPGMVPKNMTHRKLARLEDDAEYNLNVSTLINLCTSEFKWEGLPDTVDPRTLELALLCRAFAGVAPYYGNITNMGAYPSSGFNVHGNFVRFWAYGWNGYSKEYFNYLPGAEQIPELKNGPEGMFIDKGIETGVLIRDNYTCYPMVNIILLYAKRLTDTMRRIDSVSYNLVWPSIIEVNDGEESTARQMIKDHDDNLPTILGRERLDNIGIKAIDTGAKPETLTTMWQHFDRLMSRLMEIFGIESNPTIGKAERVNTLETQTNSVRTALARDNRLHCRKEAAERMNELYGWNVTVDYDETITERAYSAAQDLYDAAGRQPGSGSDNND